MVYEYNQDNKAQLTNWNSASFAKPKKARQVRSKEKLKEKQDHFYDYCGTAHHEYVSAYAPPIVTYNSGFLGQAQDSLDFLRSSLIRNGSL